MTERDSGSAPSVFDALARKVAMGSPSRRDALVLFAASALGTVAGNLIPAVDAQAKKGKKKRKRKKKAPRLQPPIPPGTGILGPSFACATIGVFCGLGTQFGLCRCLYTTEETLTCADFATQTSVAGFGSCGKSIHCPPGQVCSGERVCRVACPTS
jgi:hypothetical protein